MDTRYSCLTRWSPQTRIVSVCARIGIVCKIIFQFYSLDTHTPTATTARYNVIYVLDIQYNACTVYRATLDTVQALFVINGIVFACVHMFRITYAYIYIYMVRMYSLKWFIQSNWQERKIDFEENMACAHRIRITGKCSLNIRLIYWWWWMMMFFFAAYMA